MDQPGSTGTMRGTARGPINIWSQNHYGGHPSNPQLPDPHLGVMYDVPTHSSVSECSADTPSYISSPAIMPTPSDSSTFPSPTDSALSPYFTEPTTPASLSSDSTPVAPKVSHSRKRPPGHIPRPRNAFILFRSHYVAAQLIPGKVENDHRHISKIIGEIWNNLAPMERLIWEQRADVEKEKHSRMYPGYRYKPAKLEGVVKRRVKCRGAPSTSSAYSTTPKIGSASGPREIIEGLSVSEGGHLHFADGKKARYIDQEERRRDKARCARVAELVQRGVVGEQLEKEALRLGLDRESVGAPNPQLEPLANARPGIETQFHTNIDILRALEDNVPVFTDPFAANYSTIAPHHDYHPLEPLAIDPSLGSHLSPAPAQASPVTPANEPEHSRYFSTGVACEIAKAHRGWPHRRASSLPLVTDLPEHQDISPPTRLAIPRIQEPETAPASPMPHRPSSSSPLRRHRRLYYPYLRKEVAQKRQVDDNFDLSTCDHVSYHSQSPSSSPPEYYYSPHTHPRLQLEPDSRHPVSEGLTTNTSPLYGNPTSQSDTGQHHGPIDLSAMYADPDIVTGHEPTLHSTYAITTGESHSPDTRAPPDPANRSYPLSLAGGPLRHQASVESNLGQPYGYNWQGLYTPEPSSYDRPDQHGGGNANATQHGETAHAYYTNNSGDLSY